MFSPSLYLWPSLWPVLRWLVKRSRIRCNPHNIFQGIAISTILFIELIIPILKFFGIPNLQILKSRNLGIVTWIKNIVLIKKLFMKIPRNRYFWNLKRRDCENYVGNIVNRWKIFRKSQLWTKKLYENLERMTLPNTLKVHTYLHMYVCAYVHRNFCLQTS